MNYDEILKAELQGVYGGYLEQVHKINTYYDLYEGRQEWEVNKDLDYIPIQKITNIMRNLIDKRARFMFGKMPYFDVRAKKKEGDMETVENQSAEKEDLLEQILIDNKFHSKLLKGFKDCRIGGKIAIKLWGRKDKGLKIIFSPAQEFFTQYNLDDVDELEKVIFLYVLNNEDKAEDQRIKKQVWEMVGNKCILNETTHNGRGRIISVEYQDYNTELDFIPVIIIQNGGLTGDIEGYSDIERLWDNQDQYNKLTSDDIDALKFQMFGQDVITDADESSIDSMMIAPGALVDLQTDMVQGSQGRQAKIERLESGFSYNDKFQDTVNRLKGDMHEELSVPNISLEQLKGVITSGKSMKALYWDLISACEEDWTGWGPSLEQMIDYIFRMVDIYNLYSARTIAKYDTMLVIERYYPIEEDINEQKKIAMEEVISEVRSRKSYMKAFGEYESEDNELEQIVLERRMFEESYSSDDFEVGE